MPNLDELRQEIDQLDHQLIETLAKRLAVVAKIGQLKKAQDLPALDAGRWQAVLGQRAEWAKELGIDESLVKQIWELIHTQALKIEKDD
ncbi:MAG: chorismate mutase [Candidatus Paceibacterota bacterium]|jgi:chorismate mutase